MARKKSTTQSAQTPTPDAGQVVKSRTIGFADEEQVRLRAFQIFLERGPRPGTPEGDWLQAERELKTTGQAGERR